LCHLARENAYVWHGLIREIKPGQLYGYRVYGPWEPENGFRFNYNKMLIDPYASAIAGQVDWVPAIFPYDVASGDDTVINNEDSSSSVPKCVVVDQRFDWEAMLSLKPSRRFRYL